MIKLSIVIPAYNESKNLEKGVLNEVADYLKGADYTWEVLIVDDGSSDDTALMVENQIKGKAGFRLIKNEHGGKAIAVMTGLLHSRGEIALFTDLDQATPLGEVEKFFPYFEQGFDIVIGSRRGRLGAPPLRKLAAWGFATLRNLILGLPFLDTQCGFKAFNRKSRETLFSDMMSIWKKEKVKGAAVNAGFDVETLFLAKKMGFKITAVEISWHHVGTERVQIVRDAIDAILDMIRIRWNDWSGRY